MHAHGCCVTVPHCVIVAPLRQTRCAITTRGMTAMHDNDSNITAIRTLLPKRRQHLTDAATFPRNPRRLQRRDPRHTQFPTFRIPSRDFSLENSNPRRLLIATEEMGTITISAIRQRALLYRCFVVYAPAARVSPMASYLITGLRVFMQIPICIDYFCERWNGRVFIREWKAA